MLDFGESHSDKKIIFEHNDVHNLYQIKPFVPLYNFEQKDVDLALKEMKDLGLKNSDKIVVLINRDNNYLRKEFPKFDWLYKKQNSDIENYKQAILNLISNGYKVVRIGLKQEQYLDLKNDKYIDLYQSGKRSDLLEVYLEFLAATYREL